MINNPLPQSFFENDALYVAPRLLGKILARKIGDQFIYCQIVEVEAYAGPHDKAAHVYNYRRTPRNESMYLSGGHVYVYIIYGMHHCLNIVTGHKDEPQGVLIRGVEPLTQESFEIIRANRPINSNKLSDLTNGPGKLCAALKIDKSLNGYNIINGKEISLHDANKEPSILCAPRINIPYAKEYIQKPWRYYIKDNPYVSVKNPKSEFFEL